MIEPLKTLARARRRRTSMAFAPMSCSTRARRAVEEPRFTYRKGPRTLLDYTRLTQNGVV